MKQREQHARRREGGQPSKQAQATHPNREAVCVQSTLKSTPLRDIRKVAKKIA
jgi:hypothetical protein